MRVVLQRLAEIHLPLVGRMSISHRVSTGGATSRFADMTIFLWAGSSPQSYND